MAHSASSIIWKLQSFMHSPDSKLLPALLMFGAVSMLVYRHCSDADEHYSEDQSEDPIKKFLGMIILQMLPLVFLEFKIMSCPDPVDMLSRFGTKVILMHTVFLFNRAFLDADKNDQTVDDYSSYWNYASFGVACFVLRIGFNFRPSLHSVLGHCDVWFLVLVAGAAACLTSALEVFFAAPNMLVSFTFASIVPIFAEYIEIMAFVPACWIVLRANKSFEVAQVNTSDPRSQALYFFGFLVCFYVTEDLLNAYNLGMDIPLAAAAHLVHFLLLLDFAGFLLAHFYNPENLKGKLLRWLPDAVVPMV